MDASPFSQIVSRAIRRVSEKCTGESFVSLARRLYEPHELGLIAQAVQKRIGQQIGKGEESALNASLEDSQGRHPVAQHGVTLGDFVRGFRIADPTQIDFCFYLAKHE
jgi:hypothetical protein